MTRSQRLKRWCRSRLPFLIVMLGLVVFGVVASILIVEHVADSPLPAEEHVSAE